MLMYRPQSMFVLGKMLRYMSRKEAEERFFRNTSSLILKAIVPKYRRDMYSDYCEEIRKERRDSDMTPEQAHKRAEEIKKRMLKELNGR